MKRTGRSGKKIGLTAGFAGALAVIVACGYLNSGVIGTAYAVSAGDEAAEDLVVYEEEPAIAEYSSYAADAALPDEGEGADESAGEVENLPDGYMPSADEAAGLDTGYPAEEEEGYLDTSTDDAEGLDASEEAEEMTGEEDAEDTEPSENDADIDEVSVFDYSWEGTYVPDAGALEDNDTLFEEYVDSLFYGGYGIATLANYGEKVLEGQALAMYYTLKDLIVQVAAGTRSSTIFPLDSSGYTWTAEELGTDSTDTAVLNQIVTDEVYFIVAEAVSCLLADCPYELYWYDKISGVGISVGMRYTFNDDGTLNRVELTQLVLAFFVEEDYQGSSNVTVNTQRTAAAQAAAANAQSIAASYSGLSDREKMAAYRDEICALVSYNYSAINNPNVSYGDPWQLVYVFDGDPDTNVVCEGYAKAFQYLCDLGLTSSTSYLVTGTMSGGTGAGAHMWNVVHLDDGYNYLVDVTNCDTGTIGANGGLFLVNGESDNCVDAEDPDEYDFQIGRTTIKYLYDEHTTGLYSYDIRTLGTSHIFKIDEEPAEDTELTYGYTDVTISVEAHVDDSVEITYQWYQVEEDETGHIISYQIIDGATDHTLVIPEGIPAGTTVTFICVIDHGNSELVSHDAVVNVNKKTLTPTVSGTASKTYDGTTDVSGLSISLDGVVGDDDVTASANYEYASADAGSSVAVSVTDIELSGAAASNYELSETELAATGTILAKTVTPSLSGTASKTYDGTTDVSGLSISLDGVLAGDDVTVFASYEYASADAGSSVTVNATDITLGGADASNYVLSRTSFSTTGTIRAKTVTPVLSGTVSKTYDGTTSASGITVSLDGVVEGDEVTASANCEFDSADAGSDVPVSVTDIELGGADASNYVLSVTEADVTGTILPKTVSLTLTGTASKTYDGNTEVTDEEDLEISLGGVVSGDDVTVSASYEYASADAGSSVDVYATDIELSGTDASNYELPDTVPVTTGEILAKTVTPSLSGTASKTYDGTTAVKGLSVRVSGVVAGDDVTVSATYKYDSADAGSDIGVSVTGITLSGADASNYVLSRTSLSMTGEILKKTVTPSLSAAVSKTYDGTTDAGRITVSLEGVVEGEDVTAYADCEFASADAGSDIGVSITDIELSGADASNYVLSETEFSETGTILPKEVTLTLTGTASKTYDGTTTVVDAEDLDISIEGILDGDDVTFSASYEYASADAGNSVDIYAADIELGGADASNYELPDTVPVTTGDILQKIVTPSLSGTASKTYNGTTDVSGLAVSLDGVVAGDDVSVSVTYKYDSADAGSDIGVSVTDIKLTGADASNYELSLTELSATGEILPKTVTPVVIGAVSKTYDGTTEVSGIRIMLNGVMLADTDDVTVTAACKYASADAGNGIAVSVTDIAIEGDAASNYELSVTELSTTGTILPKELTEEMVTLPEDSFEYTGEAITPEVIVSDIVNGTELITVDDYEVSYSDNIEQTTEAKVTVTGQGNYTGSVTLTFEIVGAKIDTGETGGTGSGTTAGPKADSGATDTSGTTTTSSVRTGDRSPISPVRVALIMVLLIDAAIVVAVIWRRRMHQWEK